MDRHAMFQSVLEDQLRQPVFLLPDEVAGGWRDLFPDLAASLPVPFPIYSRDEETVVTNGYPVLVSAGVKRLEGDLERQVKMEVEFRVATMLRRKADKRKVMAQRIRYQRSMAAIIENILVNDYGRGLLEVFLLFHSSDMARVLGQVPRMLQQDGAPTSRTLGAELKASISEVFADLIQRAAVAAVNSLKKLSRVQTTPRLPPLLAAMSHDVLLLTETNPSKDLSLLSSTFEARFKSPGESVISELRHSVGKLLDLVMHQPGLAQVLHIAAGIDPTSRDLHMLLEPRLLDVLVQAQLTPQIDLTAQRVSQLRATGMRLKCFELLWALRQRVLRMEVRGGQLTLTGASSATPIANSTRPFDFASPGVVRSSVQRFGLIYDLTNFTAVLEEVRKKGHAEEERALQFMYVFQNQLEEIRQRRRLNFEKFLGDGAFYTSRRGLRLIGAACEIQQLYDNLLKEGFPFDQGLRIAMNFGAYQLLPMRSLETTGQRFEFFGHGIVELARLTTGKSTREVEQIAEFLIHSGYEPDHVEDFLGPLISARGGHSPSSQRERRAAIDKHGELINEGIVLTVPLLEQLAREIAGAKLWVTEIDGQRWALCVVDNEASAQLFVGLRYLGVARLKGLEPCELVEAGVWTTLPDDCTPLAIDAPLITHLRRLAAGKKSADFDDDGPDHQIPADLVALTYREHSGRRHWIFGEYRTSDDVLLHAINVPIDVEGIDDDSVVEAWLFKHRFELAQIYDGLRRDTSGVSTPLAPLRNRKGYVACFLSSPLKSPE